MNKLGWIVFGFFAIGVGIYPVFYFLFDMGQGLLGTKSAALLADQTWNLFFYQHIVFGGVAMLTGWPQFSRKIRSRSISVHRNLGKVYLIACGLSGAAGLYLAFYATGGIISSFGFGGLAVSWLFSTAKAYLSIRKKKINDHENWMTRSYALTFAAVTLRFWLPLSQIAGIPFMDAYPVVSWLCWVPNLLVAEWIIRSRGRSVLA